MNGVNAVVTIGADRMVLPSGSAAPPPPPRCRPPPPRAVVDNRRRLSVAARSVGDQARRNIESAAGRKPNDRSERFGRAWMCREREQGGNQKRGDAKAGRVQADFHCDNRIGRAGRAP